MRLLCQYKVQLRYVAPVGLGMPDHVQQLVKAKGVAQTEMQSLEEAIIDADVVYVTRIQRERFANPEEYERAKGQFVITPKLMTRAKRKMAVLHPLPRLNEIRYVRAFCRTRPQLSTQSIRNSATYSGESSVSIVQYGTLSRFPFAAPRSTTTREQPTSDRARPACTSGWLF